jgi:hypothetical protein
MPHRRAINFGQMPHHFAINCNKYYINKSHSVQIAPTRGRNANQNPQGGVAIDDQIPHICPPPLWGLKVIYSPYVNKAFVYIFVSKILSFIRQLFIFSSF